MEYTIELIFENGDFTLFRSSTGLWFTQSAETGELTFISEREAIETVYAATGDMEETCSLLGGGNAGRETVAAEETGPALPFEDIVRFDDSAVRTILTNIDISDLTTALAGAPETVRRRIYDNISDRALPVMKEDVGRAGDLPESDIEQAQDRIMTVALRLVETGKISMSGGPRGD